MSAIDNNTTTVLNYVEKLTEDLGILQDQNLRFVFDQGEIKFHSAYKRKREQLHPAGLRFKIRFRIKAVKFMSISKRLVKLISEQFLLISVVLNRKIRLFI